MNLGRQLYDLQQIDIDLETRNKTLADIECQLSDNKALVEAQAEVTRRQETLAELKKKQQTAEWATDDLQAKRAPLQKKLYDGSVKNPKELLGVQQQVELIKTQIRSKEDEILEIMTQVEALQEETTLKITAVEKLAKEWRKRQKQLVAERTELEAAISRVEQKRGELAATIESNYLELYEGLRANKQGQAVAKIERGRCQGCRITLPMSELQRVRTGELVQCGSCHRVLYVG